MKQRINRQINALIVVRTSQRINSSMVATTGFLDRNI